MEATRQKATDYLMGFLSDDEKASFEVLLASDTATQKMVAEISDDWSTLALLSNPSAPDSDLRSRTLMLVEEPTDLPSSLNQKPLQNYARTIRNPTLAILVVKERSTSLKLEMEKIKM